jgi:hypothetical protein
MISLISLFSYSQSTFTYLVSTLNYECIFDGTEDELGNYYMIGRRYYYDSPTDPAYMLVLNADGQLVYEHEYLLQDTSASFGSVYYKNDSLIIFGGKGLNSSDPKDELWVLILDDNFNVLKNKSFSLGNNNIGDIESTINRKGNYVICGFVYAEDLLESDIFLYEISSSGDSVNRGIIPLDGLQMEFDLIEKPEGGYKVFAYGNFPGVPNSILGKIVEFDSLFNYISAEPIPNGLRNNHSAKWLSDSVYMVTGEKQIYNPTRTDNAIIKLKADDEFISGNHFGKTGDTITYVGACSNLDFIDPESIFFGGASDIHPQLGVYQPDSWLILDNIDSNLNLNWQRFYGGDAGYYLWGLKATQDGGCLLMATRYDANIQDNELDIYILKVDANGLLTSTNDDFSIPVNRLAIAPNPATNYVSIRYPDIFGNDEKKIVIYNAWGSAVLTVDATWETSGINLNISDLPAGLYFVELIVNGKKTGSGKMVKI